MRPPFFLAVLLFLFSAPVSAQTGDRWVEFGPEGRAVSERAAYDSETISVSGAYVTVWIRTWLSEPDMFNDGGSYDEYMIRSRFDCNERRMINLDMTASLEGSVVFRSSEPGEWKTLVPDSVAEGQWRQFCEEDA